MKRILTGMLALVMVLTLTVPACADVLWEPFGNEFFEKNRNKCDYLGRQFYVDGPDGYLTLWAEPDRETMDIQYKNGTKVWIYWLYEDWGCASIWNDSGETIGWFPMEYLELVYDYACFAEEYADRITPYAGEFANYNGDAAGAAFYEYPGAPDVKRYMPMDDQLPVKQNLTGTDTESSYISFVFVDENGLTWGFVSYMYGRLNGWFCMDNPEGDGDPEKQTAEQTPVFPKREVGTVELTPVQTPVLPAKSYLPYVLVGAVSGVTAVLLLVVFKKKKRT